MEQHVEYHVHYAGRLYRLLDGKTILPMEPKLIWFAVMVEFVLTDELILTGIEIDYRNKREPLFGVMPTPVIGEVSHWRYSYATIIPFTGTIFLAREWNEETMSFSGIVEVFLQNGNVTL